MPTLEQIWLRVSKRLESKLSPDEFRTWFSRSTLKKWEDDLAVVSVPNRFYAVWIEERFLHLLTDALAHVLGISPRVEFFCESSKPRQEEEGAGPSTGLNPSMTFTGIRSGKWNRFALSSSLKVTETNGYVPLYLFSKPGLGKTHLLHAIGNRLLAERPDSNVKYVGCLTFDSECSRCIRNDQQLRFQETHSRLDALLFDDVHLLSSRVETQLQLMQIFDTLCARKKRVVFTGDRPPQELEGVIEPLGSRLGWGVIAEILRPDQNTFGRIVREKVEESGIPLQEGVISLLPQASKDLHGLDRNIRKLKAYVSMSGGEIGLPFATSLLKGPDRSLTGIDDIKTIVAGYYNIPVHDLTSGGKKRSHTHPRQVAMYIARKYTDLSFKEIGLSFGRKDHSTVIHAIRKVEEERGEGKAMAADLNLIEALLS